MRLKLNGNDRLVDRLFLIYVNTASLLFTFSSTQLAIGCVRDCRTQCDLFFSKRKTKQLCSMFKKNSPTKSSSDKWNIISIRSRFAFIAEQLLKKKNDAEVEILVRVSRKCKN